MASVHQFEYGWITPVLAYLLSFVGSLLGLSATARSRHAASSKVRARWLVLASFAIGGTGIWTMHFLAMIGFGVDGSIVRFDVPITIASWLTAVIVVGVGLFLVGTGRRSIFKIIPAGILTGVGVAGMHYSGMAAMRVNGDISYDRRYVLASVGIAVVAATVALWFTVYLDRPAAFVAASAVMAIAVCGMHYTGMFGMHVHLHESLAPISGAEAIDFLIPIMILVVLVVVALFYSLLAVPRQSDAEIQAELRARITGAHPDTRPPTFVEAMNRGFTSGEPEWEYRHGSMLPNPPAGPARVAPVPGAPGRQPAAPTVGNPARQPYPRHPGNHR